MRINEQLKIQAFEKDRSYFMPGGLDIISFINRKSKEDPTFKKDFYDYAGEYYKKPERFTIGEDIVYKKKQYAGEVPAEVVLAYAYNLVGIPSPIAYPFFMNSYRPFEWRKNAIHTGSPDGVVTKDIQQVFPTAEKRGDIACHSFKGLYTDEDCLRTISPEGRLARVKETIASIAFNNKDAGFDNSFWIKNPTTGMHESVVSIDHGYSGRDSMYGKTKDDVIRGLYFMGEHGYNGMYYFEEDRATVLYFLKRLLAGQRIDGVQFSDAEIKQLKTLIDDISKIDFTKISNDFKDKYQYTVSESYLFGLELSREDLCNELAD